MNTTNTSSLRIVTGLALLALGLGAGQGFAQTRPTLVSVDPPQGTSDVSPAGPVIFLFSEPMDVTYPAEPVLFSRLVMPGAGYETEPVEFSYRWSPDGRTLTCTPVTNLPPYALIMWDLMELRDAQGDPCQGLSFGSYNTGEPESPSDEAIFRLSRIHYYFQSSAAPPTSLPGVGYVFGAFAALPQDSTVSAVTLHIPGGRSVGLVQDQGDPRIFSHNCATNNAQACETNYPAGTYRFAVSAGDFSQDVTVNLPAGHPNVPQVLNYGAAQAINAAEPFTLTWNPFSGGTSADFVLVSISSQGIPVFDSSAGAPGGHLNGTATSVVIPANTLQPDTEYAATLTFMRTSEATSAALITGYFKQTQTGFSVQTAPGVSAFRFSNSLRVAGGKVVGELRAPANTIVLVESATNLLDAVWTPIWVTNSSTGVVPFSCQATGSARFFRARALRSCRHLGAGPGWKRLPLRPGGID